MFPKKGKKLPGGLHASSCDDEFRRDLACALKKELGSTHQAIKTMMRWTGASDRTVKNWLAGTHSPSGYHLVLLAHHSDAVLVCFLIAANRSQLSIDVDWISLRIKILEFVAMMDNSRAL